MIQQQITTTTTVLDLLHKSQNAPVPCPTMHHFVTEMCTHAHFCYKMVHGGIFVWCIVGFVRWTHCHCHHTQWVSATEPVLWTLMAWCWLRLYVLLQVFVPFDVFLKSSHYATFYSLKCNVSFSPDDHAVHDVMWRSFRMMKTSVYCSPETRSASGKPW